MLANPQLFLSICLWTSVALLNPSDTRAQSREMGELIEGQWAEGRAFDPFGDRPVQLWLPEGTLIYDIAASDRGGTNNWKYRFATTYHGYPVNLKLQPTRGSWKYKKLDPTAHPARFRLNQSVFCPAETSPIVWPASTCLHGPATGEGWTFEFEKDSEESGGLAFYTVEAFPDEQTRKDLGESRTLYRFKIYERDMNLYEEKGVLFRLDRPHPLSDFKFVGHNYFPCNTTKIIEFKEEDVATAFVEASTEAGFNFWGWFRTTLKGGIGYEDTDTEIKIRRTDINSKVSSVFQQWGVMHRNFDNGLKNVPFIVEKTFECQKDAGTIDPGSRILSVKVQFWNDEEDRNDTYEFNEASDWANIDSKLYDYMQRPVFLSINNSESQAAVVQKILLKHEALQFNQAIFIFGQINNGCVKNDRDKCDSLVTILRD